MLQSPSQDFNEQDLKAAMRQGQPEALGQLYDKYAPVLMGLATRMMRDQEAAEMVLQKTFVAVWNRRSEYEESCLSLLSWLILITRDTAMAALPPGTSHTQRTKGNPPSAANYKTGNGNNVSAALKVKEKFINLAPNEKAALDLVYLQGYTCQEAAAELGIGEMTLKNWLKTAGQHLRAGRGK